MVNLKILIVSRAMEWLIFQNLVAYIHKVQHQCCVYHWQAHTLTK